MLDDNEYISKYARMWNDPQIKSGIITTLKDQKITDKRIIEAYFRKQLEIPPKEHVQQLVHQVALEKADIEKVQEITVKQNTSQLKAGCGFTLATYLFYHLLLRKRRMFYNYFNGGRFRLFKKITGGFVLFAVNMNLLRFGYEKNIPLELEKEGLLKKYKIELPQQ